MKTIQPVGEWVLVNIISASQTVGGIVLPDSATANFNDNVVEAVGDKVTRVKPGDEIIFVPMNLVKIELPNCEKGRILVREEFIVGVLK